MKVLLLTRKYAGTDGHSNLMNTVAFALIRKGIEVKIAAFNFIQQPPQEIPTLKLSWSKHLFSFGTVAREFDIIHNFQTLMNYFSPFGKKPFIFHYQGAGTNLQIVNLRIAGLICRKSVQKYLTLSTVSANKLYKLIGAKSEIVPLAIDPAFFNYIVGGERKKGQPHLLAVTRMMKYKRNDELLRAFKKLLSIYPEAFLQIVGNGPQLDETKKLTDELGISSKVEFLGLVNRDEILLKYASCDILVSTSRLEAFPHPFLEAMALGKPIVASNIPVHLEIIQESQAGKNYRVDDVDDFVQSIIDVFRNKLEYEGKARNYATKWSVDNLGSKLIGIYNEILRN